MLVTENEKLAVETFSVGSYGCNCSVLWSKTSREAIVIDPGNDSQSVKKFLQERQLKVKQLLHTHAHFDHIGGSQRLAEQIGAELCLHRDDLELYQALKWQGQFFGMELDDPGEVKHFIQDEERFGISDPGLREFLHSLHTPGHTQGSCCFYSDIFSSPLLFSGDTLFQGSIGRTDLPGGDYEQIIDSIKSRLLTLPGETNVITGHGPATMLHREKNSNPFLS